MTDYLKKLLPVLFISVILLIAIYMAGAGTGGRLNKMDVTDSIEYAGIYLDGYDFGAGVPRMVFKLNAEASDISDDGMRLTYRRASDNSWHKRQIIGAYLSDERGDVLSDGENSQYFTVELLVKPGSQGTPFISDEGGAKAYEKSYEVSLSGGIITIAGRDYTTDFSGDALEHRMSSSDAFLKGSYTGNTRNNVTGKTEKQTLQYALYVPVRSVKNTSEDFSAGSKYPLIIWLRGASGGTEIDSSLYVSSVINLAKENVQKHFDDGHGACVLYVQAPGHWSDAGDGSKNPRSRVSRYTQVLKSLIDNLVNGTISNDADRIQIDRDKIQIDPDRIYICGFSQGAYMAMNMLENYPDYFAASILSGDIYPYYTEDENGDMVQTSDKVADETSDDISNEFSEKTDPGKSSKKNSPDSITNEYSGYEVYFTRNKAEKIKDIPIWFVQSADDQSAVPERYSLPTYKALLQAGASNCWLSYFKTVTSEYTSETQLQSTADEQSASSFTRTYRYPGHLSCIKLYNDVVTGVQDINADEYTPDNNGGGEYQAETDGRKYDDIFDWLDAQEK